MATIFFIMGRPGSGKSTFVRALKQQYGQGRNVRVINDYPILREMFEEEHTKGAVEQPQFRERWHGGVRGFDVIDRHRVFPTALCRMNELLRLHVRKESLILVEFSRNDYSNIRNTFSHDVLSNAHFLFLATPLEDCIRRIWQRVEDQRYPDDILVSEETMRKNHVDDGRDSLCALFGRRHVRIINNEGAWDNTWQEATGFLENILLQQRELSVFRQDILAPSLK